MRLIKALMKTLMTGRRSRNLRHPTKHQVRALVNPRNVKTPGQRAHGWDREPFMMTEQDYCVG
jgi:hypothetical protein